MALLQISEPGQAPDPHQRRIAVGIDLGTTHSLVASVRNGVAECLPDDQGRVLLPSAVRYLEGDRRQIGFDAVAARAQDPANTITSVKRLMGRGLADIANRDAMSYSIGSSDGGMVNVQTLAGEKSPVEISAEILATLRYRAQDTFDDDELYGAVITVPAYFDEGQRQATKDAGKIAGLNVLPDQRTHGRGHCLRPGQRERRRLRGLRPGRWHLRHLDPSAHAGRVRSDRHGW